MKKLLIVIIIFSCTLSCKAPGELRTVGSIERIDPAMDAIIKPDAKIEVLAEGFEWSEGPVWIEEKQMLLFSDVPKNTIHKWTEDDGVTVYLTPSGYTGAEPSLSREPGSNGLTRDLAGHLVICQHGDRRVARLNAGYDDPKPVYVTLADRYEGKRFNSPNDAVVRSNGDIFFTDPPYGLPQQENDTTREIPFQGVYRIAASGAVTLVVDSLTRPNGVALTPDEKTLIVANSDPAKAMWYAYDLAENDSVTNARVFFDATASTSADKGLPDGLRIDRKGNVFATGPGGVWIFSGDGKLLGRIRVPEATANCALSDEDRTLYLTSDMYLLRVKLR